MSNVLAVADSKVILMLCLAKLRRDFHEFVWRKSSPNMLWYSSMKIFLMFHCWSWLGCLSIKSLKAWIDMNSKSKSDDISSAATLDGSNFSMRKLVPRKYFIACIWCIASRALCGEITMLFGRLTPNMQQASCCKMYMQAPTCGTCWQCSSTCYTPIQCQTTTILAPACCYIPTWWPNIAWELAENRDFFLIWGMKPANMGL